MVMESIQNRPRLRTDSSSRLDDYLNDKLQTFADFETLDSLLANVKNQQALLRKQLEDAEQDLKDANKNSASHDSGVRREIQGYRHSSIDIDRRLRIITQSETSDDAVQQFDASMERLNRLEIANGYLELLATVKRLSADSTSSLNDTNQDEALSSYTHLHNLLGNLKLLQDNAEGAAPHLIDHVERLTLETRQTIKESFATQLTAVLDKILWPRHDVGLPIDLQDQWTSACWNLLTLQRSDLAVRVSENASRVQNDNVDVLFPLEIMMRPVESKFRFHFNGDRRTNRLDKPEYFLSHALEILNTYSPFILDHFQPILVEFTRGTDLTLQSAYIDASSAFVAAILPMVRSKIFALVPQLLSQPSLLSHFIHELMSFDNTIREDWRYTGNGLSGSGLWKGLTWEVLSREDWFGRWLQVEKDFALARYQSIVDEADVSTLDFDSVDEKATKPTKAAIRVHDLLETITERYRPLSSFSQKLRFLIEVQISIFDQFHARLNSGLDAFLTMTSSIGRTVKGMSESDFTSVQGLNGVDRLCRIFGSADYLERAMRDWSDDVFFLDLWNELQYRAKTHSNPHNNDPTQPPNPTLVAGPLSIAEVASRTSTKLTESSKEDESENESETGALFEETASAYARLRSRSEQVIVDTLNSTLRDLLRPYARSSPWSSLSPPVPSASSAPGDTADEPPMPSVDLNPVLQDLSSKFSYLTRVLARLPLRRVARQVMRNLNSYMFDRVIMGNTFSIQAARQVAVDIESLAAIVDRLVGGSLGTAGLRRCLEARTLLVLPVAEPNPNPKEVESSRGENATISFEDETGFDIWVAEQRLFESNHSARAVLEALGLETLTENDAREILRRRVEIRN